MFKRIYIIFILSFFLNAVTAQKIKDEGQDNSAMKANQNNRPAEDIDIDTSLQFNRLNISPDTISRLKDQKAFAYAKYLDSLLRDKQNKKKAEQPISSKPGWLDRLFSASGTKVFFWTLAAGFIFFILYKLFLTQGVFKKNVATDKQNTSDVSEESITTDSDFDALIRQGVAAGNYRLAVRYQYMKTLNKLAEKNFITKAADKTNYQYVKEINNPLYQNEFAALTLSYEYVWYGEFAIAENIYRKIESGFSGFNPKI